MLVKFNDTGGTQDQQDCQDSCPETDPLNGETSRLDMDGNSFDVYYEGSGGVYKCKVGLPKCLNCPLMQNFFTTLP